MEKVAFFYYDLLDEVRKLPAMYLGASSITRLQMYELGYKHAKDELGLRPLEDVPLPNFHSWVRARLGRDRRSIGWTNSILEACQGDEERALARFYELLDEYRSGQFSHIVEQWEAEWDAKWKTERAAKREQEAQNKKRGT